MINPVHLRTLLEVVAHRSFATAATRLGYTASAVSQQMTALERSTGTTLFVRGARSITPTAGAMRMVRHAGVGWPDEFPTEFLARLRGACA